MATQDLLKTLEKIKADDKLTKAFIENPAAVMSKEGFNTSKLKITQKKSPTYTRRGVGLPTNLDMGDVIAGKLNPLDHLGGGRNVPGGQAATVCASIGFVVCGAVGD